MTSRTRQNMTHKICSLVWLISILVVSPLFFFTDIEYKDPEDHSLGSLEIRIENSDIGKISPREP